MWPEATAVVTAPRRTSTAEGQWSWNTAGSACSPPLAPCLENHWKSFKLFANTLVRVTLFPFWQNVSGVSRFWIGIKHTSLDIPLIHQWVRLLSGMLWPDVSVTQMTDQATKPWNWSAEALKQPRFGKFDGYLSPSQNLILGLDKFEDFPPWKLVNKTAHLKCSFDRIDLWSYWTLFGHRSYFPYLVNGCSQNWQRMNRWFLVRLAEGPRNLMTLSFILFELLGKLWMKFAMGIK